MCMTQNVERFAFARFANANLRTHCVNATGALFPEEVQKITNTSTCSLFLVLPVGIQPTTGP